MKPHYLKEWREFRHLTQEDLAKKIGMARSYYTNIESGARDYNQRFLEKAAVALDCRVADIVGHPPTEGPDIAALLGRLDRDERSRIEAAIVALIPNKESA